MGVDQVAAATTPPAGRAPAAAAARPSAPSCRSSTAAEARRTARIAPRCRRSPSAAAGRRTARAHSRSGPGRGSARAAASGGIGRSSTSTRTSTPRSRTAIAWRCAQTPEAGMARPRVVLGDDRDAQRRRSSELGERGLGGRDPGDRHPVRRAADVVEPDRGEEADAVGVAAVLAADAELQIGVGAAAALRRDAHERADARDVDRLERASGRGSAARCSAR